MERGSYIADQRGLRGWEGVGGWKLGVGEKGDIEGAQVEDRKLKAEAEDSTMDGGGTKLPGWDR